MAAGGLAFTDGTAQATVATDRFGIDKLLDADGSAIVVHAAADNYANVPPATTHTTPTSSDPTRPP